MESKAEKLVARVRHFFYSTHDRDLGMDLEKQYFGQFWEDAVLQTIFREMEWKRALKCGTNASTRKGFYVDVGAFAPIQHSNTFWFYKHG